MLPPDHLPSNDPGHRSKSCESMSRSQPAETGTAFQSLEFFLYRNQGLDFDDVRVALVRLFGPGHSATIHDGDGCLLFDCVEGHSCAGTINGPSGAPIATFAIDYIMEEVRGNVLRHVVSLHIGPCGQWCRSLTEAEFYNQCVASLRSQYSGALSESANTR